MKHNVVLIVASLLSLLLMTFHMTHDVIRQAEGSVKYPIPVLIFVLWLYGTLMLSDRVLGYVIMWVGGLFGAGMIVIHSQGPWGELGPHLRFVFLSRRLYAR